MLDPRILDRAEQIRERFPNAIQPPYWWVIARPAVKIVCLTLVGAPAILTATQGLHLSPEAQAIMGLLTLAAGYGLSEMSPGFRPRP